MAKARSSSSPSRKAARPTTAKGAEPASDAAAPATPPAAKAGRGRGNGPRQQQLGQPQVVMTLTHDQIAQRAYQIWTQKGRPSGQDDQNWREAEASLQAELTLRPR